MDGFDLELLNRLPLAEATWTLFRFAAARVRQTFKPTTWRAFWMTSVEQCPVEEAAETLGLSAGAVYIARARVLARLRDEVRQMEDDHAL